MGAGPKRWQGRRQSCTLGPTPPSQVRSANTSMRTCANRFGGTGPSRPIAAAGTGSQTSPSFDETSGLPTSPIRCSMGGTAASAWVGGVAWIWLPESICDLYKPFRHAALRKHRSAASALLAKTVCTLCCVTRQHSLPRAK